MSMPDKQSIRDILINRFDRFEIKDLCDKLGNISYNQLSSSIRDQVYEIIEYYEKRMNIEYLWQTMLSMRPDISSNNRAIAISTIRSHFLNKTADLNKLDFYGYVPRIRLTTTLDKIFVEPTLASPIPLEPIVAGINRIELLAQSKAISWKELFDHGDRIIILGMLGSGKSSLLKHMFIKYSNIILSDLDTIGNYENIPIYLPLNELNISDPPIRPLNIEILTEFIKGFVEPIQAWSQFETMTTSVILLCDGLHEIPEDRQRTTILLLEEFISKYPLTKTIITIRDDNPSFDLFNPEMNYHISSIDKISRGNQGELIRKLFNIIKIGTPSNQISLIDIANIITSRSLNDTITTPLSVIISVLNYLIKPVSMPVAETLIREKILYLTLGDWDNLKSDNFIEVEHSSDDINHPMSMSSYLAYDIFDKSEEADLLHSEIFIDVGAKRLIEEDIARSNKRARQSVVQILSKICKNTNILNCIGLSTPPKYQFKRKNDILVLSAIYLHQLPFEAREQILSKRSGLTKWENVLLYIFDLLLLRSQADANQFVEYLIRDRNLHPNDFGYQLYLAATCLSRTKATDFKILETVYAEIAEVLSDKNQAIDVLLRIKLGEALGQINDPRIGKTTTIHEGEFIMGFDQFANDSPVRRIRLQAYDIDVYPVTNAQYKAFIEAEGYQSKELWDIDGWAWVIETGRRCPRYWTDSRFNKPNYPVVGVSWFEADAYARWAGRRLPTEAEWEKAARGTTGYYWPWGNAFSPYNVNSSDSAVYINGTTPIGIYPAGQSPFNVYDMAGNVSEWTSDWYQPYDPAHSSADTHYGHYFKVRRGGGWGWDQDFVRCTCRNASPRTADYAVIGFRCVK
ncbi:SUMF1/EgtB/PvdO family nonheme iron enzyme [Herpetosiphon giganteus]|uniref:SUMF1/EgtB/PvdO family nonheme iron enzyme n=1 Tax=Herpetosiphon giganteus TaxID=2029754 RepID=UPI00195EA60F|nr:SUMF1/EgtB/PvdO family nonheme iron enzyme [Herpetosiphon giganteus]MBM7846496.1 formylglycine-generating enzyme required for sulfatase activity [Herpetosiphon giganteus]